MAQNVTTVDKVGNPTGVTGNATVVDVATIAAGTNIIGKVGIDQTTPGTTNGVVLNAGDNVVGRATINQATPGATNRVSIAPSASTPSGSQDSAANTDNTITIAAVNGKVHHLRSLGVVVDGAVTATKITITVTHDAAGVNTVIHKSIIPIGSPIGEEKVWSWPDGLPALAANKTLTLKATAGGGSVVTTINYSLHDE